MSRRRRAGTVLAAVLLPVALATSARAGVTSGAGADTYTVYVAPADSGNAYDNAVEPSIGANWKTGKALFQADTTTYSVSFDDATHRATWTPHSPITTSVTTLDPILFTDRTLGHSIVSQLASTTSLAAVSDDDFATSTPSEGGGPSGVDHQTVGGGPYATALGATSTYPHAIYYCSQGIAAAFCSLSTDGGITFVKPADPMYTVSPTPAVNSCGGLHGHVRVRPDGTAMVPNFGCSGDTLTGIGARQAVVENSTDNVSPWTIDLIPDSKAGVNSDPSVDSDAANTMYFGYEDGADANGNHPAKVAVKKKGGGWSPSVDLGAPLGVVNSTFPETIAGSAGRAVVAFLGTTTGGDDQAENFQGAWQLYLSRTDDSGATWRTTQVTTDTAFPVQRGCIQLAGPCTHRNLYDFNDITVDKLGRVLVGFADGCLPTRGCATGGGDGANPDDDTNVGTIARQDCGQSLFAESDGALAAACAASSAGDPSSSVPEAPVVPALAVLGGGVALLWGVRARRRRRA